VKTLGENVTRENDNRRPDNRAQSECDWDHQRLKHVSSKPRNSQATQKGNQGQQNKWGSVDDLHSIPALLNGIYSTVAEIPVNRQAK
jgi:hypothetical protein